MWTLVRVFWNLSCGSCFTGCQLDSPFNGMRVFTLIFSKLHKTSAKAEGCQPQKDYHFGYGLAAPFLHLHRRLRKQMHRLKNTVCHICWMNKWTPCCCEPRRLFCRRHCDVMNIWRIHLCIKAKKTLKLPSITRANMGAFLSPDSSCSCGNLVKFNGLVYASFVL